jgi:hypothetical protein
MGVPPLLVARAEAIVHAGDPPKRRRGAYRGARPAACPCNNVHQNLPHHTDAIPSSHPADLDPPPLPTNHHTGGRGQRQWSLPSHRSLTESQGLGQAGDSRGGGEGINMAARREWRSCRASIAPGERSDGSAILTAERSFEKLSCMLPLVTHGKHLW